MDSESPDKYFLGQDNAVHYGVDGTAFTEGSAKTNLSDQEAREILAESSGTHPDEIGIKRPGDDTFRLPKGRKLSVGFSKWRSSWDPKGPKGNPNLN